MCPKRIASVVSELEGSILPPQWLPRSHEAVWQGLPQHWQRFLKASEYGSSLDVTRMFWSMLPESQRNAAQNRIRQLLQG